MVQLRWVCVAYGPELPAHIATCFFQETRLCSSEAECHARMDAERKRVFRRMQELAGGDPVWSELSEEFRSPTDLLYPDAVKPDRGEDNTDGRDRGDGDETGLRS
jgi:hypothetical protein